MPHEIIRLHPAAPDKPPVGAPCNGCGVCCTSAPCPIGMLVSRRTQGACAALVWDAAEPGRYRCGLIAQPGSHLPRALAVASPLLAVLARRYIAAGAGCDCDLEVVARGEHAEPGERVERVEEAERRELDPATSLRAAPLVCGQAPPVRVAGFDPVVAGWRRRAPAPRVASAVSAFGIAHMENENL